MSEAEGKETGTFRVKAGLAQMLKGGVIYFVGLCGAARRGAS
jgi:pyridoxal biosynthesis lyase PdxS